MQVLWSLYPILRNELDVSMALTGITSVADIDRRRSRGFRTRSLGRIKLVIARSESDEAIQFFAEVLDCFAEFTIGHFIAL